MANEPGMKIDRREFLKLTASAALLSHPLFSFAKGKTLGRVVVIGGGYAGAAAAKYLRMWSDGAIQVIVIEPNQHFISCPLSNLVLGGSKHIGELMFGYDQLKDHHGIQWVQDEVVAIDPQARKVKMLRGEVGYDRLVIAPGVDFMYEQLPTLQGLEAQTLVPHAWKAGPQTVNLQKQLQAMPENGVFAISIPKAPYKCPPGPYDLISQVALYLKNHKPKAKIIALDANPEIGAMFTDVDMPGGMDGVKLAALARDRWPPLKIIITSGYRRVTPKEMPTECRFFDKPYNLDRVITTIREMTVAN